MRTGWPELAPSSRMPTCGTERKRHSSTVIGPPTCSSRSVAIDLPRSEMFSTAWRKVQRRTATPPLARSAKTVLVSMPLTRVCTSSTVRPSMPAQNSGGLAWPPPAPCRTVPLRREKWRTWRDRGRIVGRLAQPGISPPQALLARMP